MEKIKQILKINDEEYEVYKFSCYLNWCDQHSLHTNYLQALLSHQKVYNWFIMEHSKLEIDFINAVSNYRNPNYKALRIVYCDFTSKIGFYPTALLKNLKVKIPKSNFRDHNNN